MLFVLSLKHRPFLPLNQLREPIAAYCCYLPSLRSLYWSFYWLACSSPTIISLLYLADDSSDSSSVYDNTMNVS